MKTAQEQVREFMRLAGQDCPDKPTMLDCETFGLRVKLHAEESVKEFTDAWLKDDLTGIADSIGDSLYVIFGTAVSCGLDAAEIFRRVHESNMSKFIDGHRDASGKWIKGPSYKPVDLRDLCEVKE